VSSYDPPHPPWRRRSKGGSKRSSRASHPQSRKRQQRKRRPRKLTGSRWQPPRLQPKCLWRCRQRPRPPRRRPPHPQRLTHPLRLTRRQRQRRLPQQRLQLRRRGRSHRQFRVRASPELPTRLRQPLGLASNRPPPRGHVPVPRADFLALRADGDRAHRGPETTRSHPRREWASRVRRVLVQMAPALRARVRPPVGERRCRVLVRGSRVCRGPTRR